MLTEGVYKREVRFLFKKDWAGLVVGLGVLFGPRVITNGLSGLVSLLRLFGLVLFYSNNNGPFGLAFNTRTNFVKS